MWIVFSHILAFSALFVAAVFDLRTTEVPDIISVAGVAGGILLHAAAAYFTGSAGPVLWSFGIGILFSVYGWGMYYLGMWGGADAFAMSVLGFAAPSAIGEFSILHSANLFVNIMLLGFIYTLLFSVHRAWKSRDVLTQTAWRIESEERRISLEIIAAASVSALAGYLGLNGFIYFFALVSMIFLYRFLQELENHSMTREVAVEDLEGGEVPAPGQGLGDRIKGLDEEDIENIEMESVEVKSGVRFVPVFPLALLATDTVGGGILLLVYLL